MKAIHTRQPRSPDGPNTGPDERFDCLTRLARGHFGVGIALIVLLDTDRLWVRACNGFSCESLPNDLSFFDHATLGDAVFVVPDASADERFRDHPLVRGYPDIRFYAGCPLIASNGSRIGAFCLFDSAPRSLNEGQREFLRDLAGLAAITVERDRIEIRLKEDERILRRSEQRMALAIAGSGTGIWDRNILSNEIYYSAGWKAILGYAESEISNRIEESYKRVHPDDLTYVQATIQAHFDQQTESYEVEHRLRCKDGSYKWVSSRGKVVSRDAKGKPLRMIGTTTDITAMREMSEQLQQTVDLVTNLTNEVPGLVFQYRRLSDGRSFFCYTSAGIKDIYELTTQQLAHDVDAVERMIHPDDLPGYRSSLDRSAATLSAWHHEYRVQLPRQGLRWRQGNAEPRRLEDGSTLWHGFITDVTERKHVEAELRGFATTDFLTQLSNRRYFMAQVGSELARIQRNDGHCAAVLMCDLDHFKSINDQWGHAVGDQMLVHFAAILRDQLRKTDIAGRVGGEEFAVVLHDAGMAEAVAFARRLQRQLAQTPLSLGDKQIALTVSVGIAAMSAGDARVDAVLSRSDRALYCAKANGRNRIECS